MFENLVKKYELEKAPATVIPVGVSIDAAKEKYGLKEVVKLASNENPFGVSPKAVEAMSKALILGHLYPDSTRDTLLKKKLACLHGVADNQVMITCGAGSALAYASEAFISEGSECIIPSPAYPPYYYNVFKNGGKIVDIPCRENDKKLDLDSILAALNEKTRLVFVCNPNNPTSTCYKGADLIDFIKKIPLNVIVVVDEAYIDFTDDPEETTMVQYLSQIPNMIVIRTFSKIYGMAGIRCGYALACSEIINYMNKVVASRTLNTIGIEGAIAALEDSGFRAETIRNNREQRDLLTKTFTDWGYKVYESQSNFVFVDFKTNCQELYFKLLQYGVMIRGDFDLARISIGTPRQNKALIDAMSDLRKKGEI